MIAIGRNIFPSTPVEREDRQVDDQDDQHAEQLGRITWRVASRPRRAARAASSGPPSPCSPRASRRMQFSTMITAPSTIRPKSMAPEAHQVRADPAVHHAGEGRRASRAGSRARGCSAARDVAEQERTGSRSRAARPRPGCAAPSRSCGRRARCGRRPSRACTPGGRLRLISASFAATRCETARLFSPISMKTVPEHDLAGRSRWRRRCEAPGRGRPRARSRRGSARRPACRPRSADVLEVAELAGRAHQVLLAVALDVAAAACRLLRAIASSRSRKREPVGDEPLGSRRHVYFLHEAADGVHLGDARARCAAAA